jgi:hypothetical protein
MIRLHESAWGEASTPNLLLSVAVILTPNNTKVISGVPDAPPSTVPTAPQVAADIAVRKRGFRVVMTTDADDGNCVVRRSEVAQVEPHHRPRVGLVGELSWMVQFCVLFQVPISISRDDIQIVDASHQERCRRATTAGDGRLGGGNMDVGGGQQNVSFQVRSSSSITSAGDFVVADATCKRTDIQGLVVGERLQVPLTVG